MVVACHLSLLDSDADAVDSIVFANCLNERWSNLHFTGLDSQCGKVQDSIHTYIRCSIYKSDVLRQNAQKCYSQILADIPA